MHLTQSGIGLPDESYYREDSYAETRAAYLEHVRKMLTLAGRPDPVTDAQTILDLETQIAAGHWDVVRRRDAELSYNLVTLADLSTENDGFDWAAWVSGLIHSSSEMLRRYASCRFATSSCIRAFASAGKCRST